MSYNLNTEYEFNNENFETPDLILEDICKQLNNITKSFVQGNVKKFDGQIESYSMLSIDTGLNNMLKVNIQDELGEVGDKAVLRYEFFISAPKIKNYKYRIMFLEYGITGYPVKIVLEQGIADELNDKENSGYVYEIETKQEFEDIVVRIINTKKIRKIIQDLINISGKGLKKYVQTTAARKTDI